MRTMRMRPVLQSLNVSDIESNLYEMQESVDDVRWFVEQGDETFLNALDGDEETAHEFRMLFSDLSYKVESFWEAFNSALRNMDEETFDDCVVGLLGNRYKPMYGYFDEGRDDEDYRSLMDYEAERAETVCFW